MTTSQKHSQTAREFLAVATREFATGDNIHGSEKMWGAAVHAVIAVAQQRGWPCDSDSDIKAAAYRMAEEQGEKTLTIGFLLALGFRANSSIDYMEDDDIERALPAVKNFVTRLLALV